MIWLLILSPNASYIYYCYHVAGRPANLSPSQFHAMNLIKLNLLVDILGIVRTSYRCEERLRNESCSGIQLSFVSTPLKFRCHTYKELHLRNLLINLLHKLNDKVHQFMLQHLLGMKVGDQERNVISLYTISNFPSQP